ncbi:MAG: hypothetical protein JJU09_07560 [Rhodobacteraceae bacterium]|nr:hypothetical protein [Paracoccaceae bacterium]
MPPDQLQKQHSHASRRGESLRARQSRVGIIVNPVPLDMPRPSPRDVWLRWPRLRSARRAGGGRKEEPAADPILTGDALRSFARELREEGAVHAVSDTPGSGDTDPADTIARQWDRADLPGLMIDSVARRDGRSHALPPDTGSERDAPDGKHALRESPRIVYWSGFALLGIALSMIGLSLLSW